MHTFGDKLKKCPVTDVVYPLIQPMIICTKNVIEKGRFDYIEDRGICCIFYKHGNTLYLKCCWPQHECALINIFFNSFEGTIS